MNIKNFNYTEDKNYYELYSKYKIKYLNLKNQNMLGGATDTAAIASTIIPMPVINDQSR